MGKNTLKKLSLFFCILLLLAFGSNVCAAEAPYYADEEAGTFGRDPIEITPYNGIVPRAAADGNLIVVIDPGHGGIDGGASNGSANERDLNLKVAQYCKTYLEKYPNVTVYLTRSDNESKKLELTERADIGAQYGADIIISMHFNSGGGKGAEAYISCLEEYELKNFATAVVNNLGDLGLNKRGVKTRESSIKEYWYDGERLADYYGMIREPAEEKFPALSLNTVSSTAKRNSMPTQVPTRN